MLNRESFVTTVVRFTGRRTSAGGAVLCFHGTTLPGDTSASPTHVPVATVAASIDAAREFGEIVPLGTLVHRHRSGRPTAGLVALTFDDAYASLLDSTAELLRRQNVPVTVFVTTAAAAAGARFWWDRIDEAASRASAERWRRFEDDCGLPAAYRSGQPPTFGRVRPMRQWILSVHRGRWPGELDSALACLEAEVGSNAVQRSMRFEEIELMRSIAPVEIGVHTRTHPFLPALADEELVHEIRGCHRELRERFGSVLPVLAVPFGLFDARTLRLAAEARMNASLSLANRTLAGYGANEEIPRFCVTREEPVWTLPLRISGAVDRVRAIRKRLPARYPALPSATT